MRQSFLAGLVINVLGLLFTAATVLAAMKLETGLGLARGSLRTVDTHVDLTALQHGLLSWDALYESHEDPLAAWGTIPRLSNMQLEEGVRSSDPCLKLFQVERFYAVGRTTMVRLCAARNGTRIYLNQRLYLRP